jgi:hypothetical protein
MFSDRVISFCRLKRRLNLFTIVEVSAPERALMNPKVLFPTVFRTQGPFLQFDNILYYLLILVLCLCEHFLVHNLKLVFIKEILNLLFARTLYFA